MFPVAAAAKFSIVVCPFQSPLCVPGNLCHIVRGRAGPTSLIKVLWSASWTSTNKLPYILWWPVYSHTYLNYNHQCHSWVLSVWCQPAWEEKVSVEELPWSGLSVRHFLDDSWYRRALPTVGGAILACTPGLMRNAADQGMEPVSKQPPRGVRFRSFRGCLAAAGQQILSFLTKLPFLNVLSASGSQLRHSVYTRVHISKVPCVVIIWRYVIIIQIREKHAGKEEIKPRSKILFWNEGRNMAGSDCLAVTVRTYDWTG